MCCHVLSNANFVTHQLAESTSATDSPITVQDYMYGNPDAGGFHMGGPQPFVGSSEPAKRTIPVSDLPKISLALIKKRLAERFGNTRLTIKHMGQNPRNESGIQNYAQMLTSEIVR